MPFGTAVPLDEYAATSEGIHETTDHAPANGWAATGADERAAWWFALDPATGELSRHAFASTAEASAYRDAHGAAVWRPTLSAAALVWGGADGD